MDKHADFERTSIEGDRFRPRFALSALGGESEINLIQHHYIAARVGKPAHE
jgi:hypothetical protein